MQTLRFRPWQLMSLAFLLSSQGFGQGILLKGKVVDNGDKPFAAASLTLAGANLKAVSASDGSFEIRSGGTTGIGSSAAPQAHAVSHIRNGTLTVNSDRAVERFGYSVSTVAGQVVLRSAPSRLAVGSNRFELFGAGMRLPHGVHLVTLEIDGIASTSMFLNDGSMRDMPVLLGSGVVTQPAAARSAASVPDTLVVTRNGTTWKKVPVPASVDTSMLLIVNLDASQPAPTGSLAITGSGAWFEAAWVSWIPAAGATGYAVSWKDVNGSAWTPVAKELVRGNRVDIPGLPGGVTYQIKVEAIGSSATGIATVKPASYDRSGFAFDKRSPCGDSGTTGGYLSDGRINPGSQVLYVTDANRNAIELGVTKGKTTTTYTGLVAIMNARTSAKSSVPLVVRFLGTVTAPAGLDTNKMLQLKDNGNITYEGVGDDATLSGWGFDFQRCTNLVVRNLGFQDQPEDQISIQNTNLNIWIAHNDHYLGKGNPGADADKLYGDGPLDIKSGSSWASVAYNHYHGCKKTNGIGFGGDSTDLVMTFHHNFYDSCGSRMPRISYVSMHVYNSYFKAAQTYAIAAANGCSAYIQGNFFENSKRPMITASQGHDLHPDGSSTLSHNPGGTMKLSSNYLDAFSSDTAQFDPKVDATLAAAVGGAVYNGFETRFGQDYPQRLDSPELARAKVREYAGRLLR